MTLGATGSAREKSRFTMTAREFEFADLKGDLDRVGELAGGFEWKAGAPAWLALERLRRGSPRRIEAVRLLGVGRKNWPQGCGNIQAAAGYFLSRSCGWIRCWRLLTRRAWLAALSRLPRFPAVERDFSLLLNDGTTFAQVVETIRGLKIPELQTVEAGDLFRGKNVPAGKFSLLVRVTFQSSQTTLTDAQLTDFSARIVGALEKSLGAILRQAK